MAAQRVFAVTLGLAVKPLGPLFHTAAIELAGWAQHVSVPVSLLQAALLIVGWQTGLPFTRDSLIALGRVFL